MKQADTQFREDEQKIRKLYRFRVALFAVSSIIFCFLLGSLYNAIQTIAHLDRVERERDTWQRPEAILAELNIERAGVVVDLGSGVGYFTLKLSDRVGKAGKVLAVDIQQYPLYVLRSRALVNGRRNIETLHGTADDPHLPSAVDAVLIVNTYHELTAPTAILAHLHGALKREGRLVVVDRSPDDFRESNELEATHHEIDPSQVARELVAAGFEIVRRDDHFVDPPREGHIWWLIVARKV